MPGKSANLRFCTEQVALSGLLAKVADGTPVKIPPLLTDTLATPVGFITSTTSPAPVPPFAARPAEPAIDEVNVPPLTVREGGAVTEYPEPPFDKATVNPPAEPGAPNPRLDLPSTINPPQSESRLKRKLPA